MTSTRPASAYVHGDGAVVIVPGRVAAHLDRLLNLNRLRIEVRGQDPETDNVLVALRLAALAWRSAGGLPDRTSPDPMPPWITTGQAAELLAVDPRHVRRLITTGRLTARQLPSGAWLIDRETVEHYRAARHHRAA
ncbi:helix-turn-helix domain-containing protein [Yinghuangia sp. YIM S10712]|uniref:helix-turn-helix domain-containing protein n=1 Tax=Yinghuangia sp. YIM S10712 TaxID=3436930 RepID=UPI003F530151